MRAVFPGVLLIFLSPRRIIILTAYPAPSEELTVYILAYLNFSTYQHLRFIRN